MASAELPSLIKAGKWAVGSLGNSLDTSYVVSFSGVAMLQVHFLPALTSPSELAGGLVVVIDVLRASTTITHALASGASEVAPCLEIDEARNLADRLPPDSYVLGGERDGLPIDGFHLGNSPIEYTRRRVEGKTVIFTTTNGTRAMMNCHQAQRVLVGCFVNLSAICRVVAEAETVHLLCAGTGGRITREDVLFAGAIVKQLSEGGRAEHTLNDQARLARDSWNATSELGAVQQQELVGRLAAALRECQGGRNLRAIGLEGDIDTAAQIDRFSIVPQLDVAAWKIRIASR